MDMSSREVGLAEARKLLGDLVRDAQYGITTVITRNNKPAARIAPIKEKTMATETAKYALVWEDPSGDEAWVIRIHDARTNEWDVWLSTDTIADDAEDTAKEWATAHFAAEGLTVADWKRDSSGDWIPAFTA